MTVEVRASASPGEVRVAVLCDGALLDYAIWRPGAPDGVGDLHRGRIVARVPAMAGAFVALAGAEGFLPDSAGAAGHGAGDILGVRVTRAAAGGKGPRLTAMLDAAEQALVGSGPLVRLRRGPDAVRRLAGRHAAAPVIVDDAALAAELRPDLGPRLSIADAFDPELEAELATLADAVVDLPHGARLSIHPTPALVAIDLDAGRATAARSGKRAAQRGLNLAVLPALARQIRLRELGGAILVDFAGLSVKDRAALGPPLRAALADDPVGPRLLGFTALGLAEIVRPRVQPPLHELLAGPHAAGLAALRQIAREGAARPQRPLTLRAAPAVLDALTYDPAALSDLRRRTGRHLVMRRDPALPDGGWIIEEPDD